MLPANPHATSSRERAGLCLLFYLQAHAQALWYVPFSNVLEAHGLKAIVPYAFACSSLAFFISPMISGALADRHVSAERVLRWLSAGTGLCLLFTFTAIGQGWGPFWVLALLQLQQLFYAPTWGLAGAIVLSRLERPDREFGAIRVWGTFGWLTAGPIMSFIFHADSSVVSGYVAGAVWLTVAAFSFALPCVSPAEPSAPRSWRDLLGWDAFSLLRNPNHRPVFVTAGLLSIPLAAFYPFAVIHLREAGEPHPAAAMSLGQVSETIAMYALAPLLARVRLKTLFMTGIFFGVMRYVFFAVDTRAALLSGVALHGFCYTLFFISAQIYLDQKVDRAFRTRAQTLLSLMMSGVGTFVGALSCGWWREWCMSSDGTHWSLYWSVLAVAVLGVFVFFGMTYRDSGSLSVEPIPGTLPPAAMPMNAEPE